MGVRAAGLRPGPLGASPGGAGFTLGRWSVPLQLLTLQDEDREVPKVGTLEFGLHVSGLQETRELTVPQFPPLKDEHHLSFREGGFLGVLRPLLPDGFSGWLQ